MTGVPAAQESGDRVMPAVLVRSRWHAQPHVVGEQRDDDTTAVLVYDTATVPVAHVPGAECHTVVDGRITELRIVFDRLPFETARRSAAAD